MTKKLLLLPLAFLFLGSAQAQMVGTNAYVKATGIELGFDGTGGYEGAPVTTSPVPGGMHYRSTNPFFGFVANPQNDAWATFDGDFFTPGSPENGWGFEMDTIQKSNNCTNTLGPNYQIYGSITTWTYNAPEYIVEWDGYYSLPSGAGDLLFKINYNIQETDLFYTTTVTITNNSSDTLPEVYYYRNLDPDNNVQLTGDFATQNTIVSQPYGGGTFANVTATASTPWNSYFSFLTDADPNWRTGYGGFSNRSAIGMWNGVGGGASSPFESTVGATLFADEAIFIAYKTDSLMPLGSQTFKFCSVFDPGSADCAIASMGASHAPIADVNVTAAPFVLTGGYPQGGTYSGIGVVNDSVFDPSISGAGDFNLTYVYADTAGCNASTTVTVHVGLTTGIEEDGFVNTAVYPNPVTDEAKLIVPEHVKLINAHLSIVDVLGKEVKNVSNISSNTIKIDRTGMSNGIYFYKLYNSGKPISTGKIVFK